MGVGYHNRPPPIITIGEVGLKRKQNTFLNDWLRRYYWKNYFSFKTEDKRNNRNIIVLVVGGFDEEM